MASGHVTAKPSPFPLMWDTPERRRTARGPAGKAALRLWQQAFIMFGFGILSGAITPALRYARGEEQLIPGETDIGNTISQIIILGGVVIYFARNRHVIVDNLRALMPYIVIMALCLASTVWSQFPALTARRWVTLTNCILFGLLCAEEAGFDQTIRLYGRTTIILMMLSIVAYFGVPKVGHDVALGYSDAMRGVYAQKNTLGEGAVLAIACSGYALLNRPRWPAVTILSMFFLMGCIFLAKSATSLGIAAVLIITIIAIYVSRMRAGPLLLFGMGSVAVIFAFVVVIDPDILFAIANRNSSLTGRVPLWQMSLKAIWQRPLLGYGYAAFWNEGSINTQYIWQMIDWDAPSAHNGYIDVALQLGIVGLGIYVMLWGRIIYDAARAAAKGNAPEAVWVLLYMLVNMLLNMDEGPLPYPDQFTALMPATLIFLWKWRQTQARAAVDAIPPVAWLPERPARSGIGSAVPR